MERKSVYMVSGNKGGVGKSLFCLALASVLEQRGESFAVLDGDGRAPNAPPGTPDGDVFGIFLRKCPARSADFRELDPEAPNCLADKPYELMVQQLLSSCDNLIINTPDGADKTLMKWFDKTLSHTELNDSLFKFMYLFSDRPDGLDMLNSLRQRFSFLYPIRNLHFGDSSIFTAFNHGYADWFNFIAEFPVLRGEETRMLFDVKTYPSEALRLKGGNGNYALPTLSRARLIEWIYRVEDEIGNIIDNETMPNVKAMT